MAKSKHSTRGNGTREAAGEPLDATPASPGESTASRPEPDRSIAGRNVASKRGPGRPRKKSRRGQGGGPKTAAGKAKVSRNAIKHGIYSFHSVVIEGIETEEAWDRFRAGFLESLAPVGGLEEYLAERIALTCWRLRRVTHAETAILNRQVQETASDLFISESLAARGEEVPDPEPMRLAAHQQSRIIPDTLSMDKLLRYESHLHRIGSQLLVQLEATQGRRLGQPSPIHRLDIISSPAQFGPQSTPKLPDVLPGTP